MAKIKTESVNIVTLDWRNLKLNRKWSTHYKTGMELGVYLLEGRHNAHPFGNVLYIGETGGGGARAEESAKSRLYSESPPHEMYPCYWDMVCRWAVIEPPLTDKIPELTNILECILVITMAPALNDKLKVGSYPKRYPRNLIVCNRGDKGLLLPWLYPGHFAPSNR